jgi:hypothetical protein
MNTSTAQAELDLSIANMDTATAESSVRQILNFLPGIHAARLIERGAWVEYSPSQISADQICSTLNHAGFRASQFQESQSGRTGLSSF